jgi:poly-gamma-glutamate synthesis protein (capsule biosynthesis protein)
MRMLSLLPALGLAILLPLVAGAGRAAPVPLASAQVRLAAVGDVMLGRGIGPRLASLGVDWPFARVAATLQGADLAVANLECVIAAARTGAPVRKAYTFRAPPAAARSLQRAGIDWISVANNHSFDYGPAAFAEQQALLAGVGIATAGGGLPEVAYAPVYSTVRGLRLAFLSYVMVETERGGFQTRSWAAAPGRAGIAWADPAVIRRSVAAARREADVVIVALHAGIEGSAAPSAFQRTAARAAIDAGAALVLGHHSHVLGPVERYRGGVIAYSLGNFVFDGFAQDPPSRRSAIFQATLTAQGVTDWALLPVQIVDGRPVPVR